MSKTGTFHVILELYGDFLFLPILTFQKVFRVIFRILHKNLTYIQTCIAAIKLDYFLTFFTW